MPGVLVEVRRQYSREEERALLDAVYSAMLETFAVQPSHRNVRLVAYESHRYLSSPDETTPEFHTQITIDAFPGRSSEAKRNLYAAIARNLEVLGIPRDHVEVMIREIPVENWGVRGSL